MLLLELISLLLLFIGLVLTLAEYVALVMMVSSYYRNGPFASRAVFKSVIPKHILIDRFRAKKLRRIWHIREVKDSLFLSLRPSRSLYYLKRLFPTQRLVVNFSEQPSGCDISCEIRPFYSVFILPVFLTFSIILSVVLDSPDYGIGMKIFLSIFVSLISFAMFLPFRPRSEVIKEILKQSLNGEEESG